MITKTENGTCTVRTATYALTMTDEKIGITVAGEELAWLRPVSAVNTCGEGDTTNEDRETGAPTLTASVEGGVPTYVWTSASALWNKKEYVVRCFEDRFEYSVRLSGKGAVDTVNYFCGDLWSDRRGSFYEFDTGFSPLVTVTGAKQCRFSAQETQEVFSYLMVPPMFLYSFTTEGVADKLVFGLAADKGEHNFTQFNYKTAFEQFWNSFWFCTDQAGHAVVDGTWETPRIIVYTAGSDNEAMKLYGEYYFKTGLAKHKDITEKKPRAWYGPMGCGWIEQDTYNRRYGDAWGACEKIYTNFIAEFEKRDLHPKLVIIDDKWQKGYGSAEVNTDMWPDMRAFIDNAREEHGINVMLWYKLWDGEGLPEDECLWDPKEKRFVADPTNPKYRAHLKKIVHNLLSSDEGCMNAYGFKLDYAFQQPVGREVKSYDGRYGVELFLELIKLIYESVKEVKPDAIVNCSPCHPLFAEYVDHARLHDYFPALRRCFEEFRFRKECYEAALPGALIDTDGAAFVSHRDTMRYMRLAPTIGIPDIYCITNPPTLELTDEDWASVAAVWKEYDKKIDAMIK